MKWTTDKPTKPGYYRRVSLKADINDCLEFDGEDWLLKDGQYSTDPIENDPDDMQYAGPMPEPSNNFDVHDYIDHEMTKAELSAKTFVVIYHLGYSVYCEALRQGAHWPHHR